MNFSYRFPAVKGVQANREYFIAMVPLGVILKLFQNEDDYILPEYRAQRCINESRIPEIRDYILFNRDTYVFSALSASIDGNFNYAASELDANLGILNVDMDSIFLINDGQHRKAAIEAAINEDESLRNETIAIVFFKDEGLKRSQQMFADLNKHAVKSTMSLSTLYDSRDAIASAVKDVVAEIPFLNKYVDKEKDALGKNSQKLFTLANFLRANKRILKDKNVGNGEKDFLKEYWEIIFSRIDEWNELENKRICKRALREEYILTLSVTLNAFGKLGRYFIENQEKLDMLANLNKIDWMRTNKEWINRALTEHGKIVYNEDSITKICNLIKLKLGISLSKEELSKEEELKN